MPHLREGPALSGGEVEQEEPGEEALVLHELLPGLRGQRLRGDAHGRPSGQLRRDEHAAAVDGGRRRLGRAQPRRLLGRAAEHIGDALHHAGLLPIAAMVLAAAAEPQPVDPLGQLGAGALHDALRRYGGHVRITKRTSRHWRAVPPALAPSPSPTAHCYRRRRRSMPLRRYRLFLNPLKINSAAPRCTHSPRAAKVGESTPNNSRAASAHSAPPPSRSAVPS